MKTKTKDIMNGFVKNNREMKRNETNNNKTIEKTKK